MSGTVPQGYVPAIEDPWPTPAQVMSAAAVVAKEAQRVYGGGLKGVWLYGSRARGDNLPDSDLDILVVKTSKDIDPHDCLRQKLQRTLLLERFRIDIGTLLSLHVAYAEQFEKWDTMFFRNVRAEAIRVA